MSTSNTDTMTKHPADEAQRDAVVRDLVAQARRRIRHRRDAHAWAAVVDPVEGARVLPRSELVGKLKADDLPDLAREVGTRRLPAGHVLILFLDDDDAPHVASLDVDLVRRRAR